MCQSGGYALSLLIFVPGCAVVLEPACVSHAELAGTVPQKILLLLLLLAGTSSASWF